MHFKQETLRRLIHGGGLKDEPFHFKLLPFGVRLREDS